LFSSQGKTSGNASGSVSFCFLSFFVFFNCYRNPSLEDSRYRQEYTSMYHRCLRTPSSSGQAGRVVVVLSAPARLPRNTRLHRTRLGRVGQDYYESARIGKIITPR
jgi:hypothetical protein